MNLWLLLGVTGADLTDADLRGADFSLANVAKVSPLLQLAELLFLSQVDKNIWECHVSFIWFTNQCSWFIVVLMLDSNCRLI